jgi:multicomponent Na+:H+ antiporter subunit B
MIHLLDIILLTFMVIIAFTVVRLHNLFAAIVLTGIYSLLSASVFTILDAVDVAFTEAAVGAGIATILMLGTLALTSAEEKVQQGKIIFPLMVVILTGAVLIYGTLDMPQYGDPKAHIHQHVAPRYIIESPEEIGVPNMVTSVLASYRGYDTLGEVTVIFTAGIGVVLLLGRSRRNKSKEKDER